MVAYDSMSRAELIETIGSLEARLASAASGTSSPPGIAALFPVFGERERQGFEKSPWPIRIVDRETTKYLAVNDATLKLYGYTRAEFLNLTPLDTRHPDEPSDFSATLAEPTGYLRHRPPRRHKKKSGEMIVVEIITQDIVFDGRPARLSLTLDVTERVRMETLLRKREQEFSALVENAPDIIARFDRELRHVYVNPAVAAASGIARRAFTGKTHRELGMPEPLVAFWEQEIRRVFDSGEGASVEFQCPCHGGIRHFEARMVPEPAPDGATETVLAVARDITDRKRAEELLKQRTQEFETLAENLPDLVARFDRDHRYVYINSAVERLTGRSRQEIVGKTQRELEMPPDLISSFEESLRDAFASGSTHHLEFCYPAQGGARQFEAYHVPELDAGGNIKTVLCIARDITARKQVDGELRRQKALLDAIIDNLPVGVFIRDALTSRYLLRNRLAQEKFGHAAPGSLGMTVHELYPKELAERMLDADRQAFETRQMVEIPEQPVPGKSGETRIQHVRKVPLYDEHGQPWVIVGIADDITERKRAELAMQRSAALARLLESLARAANEALTPEAAMAACLERICIHGSWTLGRLALFERGKPEDAPPRSVWYAPERERFAELIRVTDGRNHRERGGFINRVLREQAAVWIEDLQQLAGVGHIAIAAKQGLRTGFAFPIVVTGQVVALIEVLSTEPRPQDPLLMAAAQTIASQLARIAERAWAQESNARMAAIVESSQDAIISRTLDGTILTWNSAAERLFGYSAAEVLGRHFSLIVPTEHRQEAASRQALLEQGGRIPAFETVRITKDGRGIEVSLSASPIREDNGAVRAVSIIIRDITERKRAEEELKRQKKLLDAIIEHLPVGVTVRDARTQRYLLRNRMAAELTGLSNAEIIGKCPDDIYPPALAELVHASDREAMASGSAVSISPQVLQYFTRRIARNLKVPVPDDTGRYTHFVSIIEDLTDIEQAQAALRRSEERLSQLISMSPAAIFSFSLDPPFGATFVSANVTAQTGWLPSDFTSDPSFWFDHIHPEDQPRVGEAVSRVATDGKYACDYRFRHKDGSWRWMRDEGQIVRAADGRPCDGIAVWMDITAERLESEERVQRALRQRDALVREVHHRIKNHLQGIAGLLRQKANGNPAIANLVESAVAQLHSVAMIYGLQSESAASGVSLPRVLAAICSSAESLIGGHIVCAFAADAAGALRLAETEAVPVAVALNELVLNALKHHARDGGEAAVEVACVEEGERAEITIVNRGKLPAGFDYVRGIDTGTGLNLVRTLLASKGSKLSFYQRGDKVETMLKLSAPVVAAAPAVPLERVA